MGKKENLDNALSDFNESVRLNPKFSKAYHDRGRVWADKGDLESALNDYTEAVRLSPDAGMAHNDRGIIWLEKQDYDRALEDFDNALGLDPDNALAFNNRGLVWMLKGRLDDAIKDYGEAIRLDPKDAAAYKNRGNALEQRGDVGSALKDYAEAVRLNPKYGKAHNSIAWLRATCADDTHRNGGLAVEHATKACELAGWNHPAPLDTLAAAYAEAGDFDQAVRWQSKAIEMLTDEKQKQDYGSRLDLYKLKKPYRTEPKQK